MEEYGDDMSLVISDVVMPGSGGQELSGLIRERWPDVGVLFMSGYSDDDVRRHGLIGDEESFIEKPFTPDGLAQKVRDTLDELAVNLPQNQR
jgi:DNA-binding NtrC family response regulator